MTTSAPTREAAAGPTLERRPVAPPTVLVLLLLSLAVLATLAGVALTGAAKPPVLGDPGAVVRWGLPVLKTVVDLATALTIGLLVMAAVALPASDGARSGLSRSTLAHRPALLAAGVAAGVWALANLALFVTTCADGSGTPLGSPILGAQLKVCATDSGLGAGQQFTIAVAVVISLAAAGARTLRAAGLLSCLGLSGLIPPALAGHSQGGNHETAVTGLGLHLAAVSLWVGGLLALALVWRTLTPSDGAKAARRFSPVALWSFVFLGISGVISAWIRIGTFQALGSRYGALVLAKTALLVLLGVAGWWHRRRTLTRLDDGRPGAFTRLAIGELVLMTVASGLAAALARSAPPIPKVLPPLPSMARQLTGYDMPPPPTLSRWLLGWQPDLLWIVVAVVAGGLYLRGVVRISRRGDGWPVYRTLFWFAGLLAMVWLTSGGPMVYGRVQFSAHMLGHMMLSMLVPLMLVMAAPMILALRTLPSRHDGTRGPREWLLAALESWYSRQITRPAVAGLFFAGTLFMFYFSPLFPVALRTHIGHEIMHVHFIAAGYLFLWVLIGPDPGPRRPSPALRMMFMFAVITFHTFFGVALMMSKSVLAEDFFSQLQRPWATDLLADQHFGGGLAWGLGEVPMIAVALILAVQWSRSDDREARRRDRAADRDGDAELEAYNAMLTGMAERDARRG